MSPSSTNKMLCAKLTSRVLIQLTGPTATTIPFLSSLITNSIDLTPRPLVYTAFLSQSGRILCDSFIHTTITPTNPAHEIFVECDGTRRDGLVAHLKRFVLRSKIGMVVRDDMHVYHFWDPHTRTNALITEQQESLSVSKIPVHVEAARDLRHPNIGYRTILSSPPIASDITIVTEKEYKSHRIGLGIPEGPEDFTASSLPLEMNLDVMNGVDFKKGCYLGQELTIRTKHTGVVRKRVFPIQANTGSVDGPDLFTSGAELKRGGKTVAKIGSSFGNLGLALIRIDNVDDEMEIDNVKFKVIKL